MLDVSVSYERYRFLGPEFLTWLWYACEDDSEGLRVSDRQGLALSVGNRIVIQKSGEGGAEEVRVRGETADFDEAMLALRKGGLVTELHLECSRGDQVWRFTLKGENLAMIGLRTPPLAPPEEADEIEGAVLEKVALCEQVVDLVEALFQRFMKLRISQAWRREIVPKIRAWVERSGQS
jgi:hypothetical protein